MCYDWTAAQSLFYHSTVTLEWANDHLPACDTPETETLYNRFVRYLEDAHRDGVIGDSRYAVAVCKAQKLRRFLIIKGYPTITANDFTADMVLEFRQFVYDNHRRCFIGFHAAFRVCFFR